MQRDLPSAPDLLQRATHGEPAALATLLCVRKERACELARTLSLSSDREVPDVPASMEELADSYAHSRASPVRASREPSSGTFTLGAGANAMEERVSAYMQRALLRRWQLVSALCHALVGLSYEQRAVLVLLDVEGLETDQVGWLMGFSEAEVRALVFPARAALRALLLTGRYMRNSA
jgi:DNA-directed RNA polymerase specialized sigma24 family protein